MSKTVLITGASTGVGDLLHQFDPWRQLGWVYRACRLSLSVTRSQRDGGKNSENLRPLRAHDVVISPAGWIGELQQKISRSQLERRLANVPRCLIGMEACSELPSHRPPIALGHDMRLIPAQYVKPFLKGHKNDYRDANAAMVRGPFHRRLNRGVSNSPVVPLSRASRLTIPPGIPN